MNAYPRIRLGLMALLIGLALALPQVTAQNQEAPMGPDFDDPAADPAALFAELDELPWQESFTDAGDRDWEQHWFLDGQRASVRTTPQGMVFEAGPVVGDRGSNAVLWSHASYADPVRVAFDYTRLDDIQAGVNLLYLLATGTGEGPHDEDIAAWNHLRDVPYMHLYFNGMNLVHLSYATSTEGQADYVRCRQYPTGKGTFNQMHVAPDYRNTGLFLPGVTYRFVAIKRGPDLVFRVSEGDEHHYFAWSLEGRPEIRNGRIGLRHMSGRCSRYANVLISSLN